MKPDCDLGMTERLVDFVDGTLPPAEAAIVQDHLTNCAACRNTEASLRRSLRATRFIWEDAARDLESAGPVVRFSKRRWIVKLAGIGVAAGLITWLALMWHATPPDQPSPVATATNSSSLTESEIRLTTARAGMAMQLLVAADLLREYPEGTDLACERYRYVASAYADTEAAEEAEDRLQTICLERGES